MPAGPYTHVFGYRVCSRCGITLVGSWPEGTLLTAMGDGRWRVVERPSLERPICPLSEYRKLRADLDAVVDQSLEP